MRNAGNKRLPVGTLIVDKAGPEPGIIVDSFEGTNGIIYIYASVNGEISSQYAPEIEPAAGGLPRVTDADGRDPLARMRAAVAESSPRNIEQERLREQEEGDSGEWCDHLSDLVFACLPAESAAFAACKAQRRAAETVHDDTTPEERRKLEKKALFEWEQLPRRTKRRVLNGWHIAEPERRGELLRQYVEIVGTQTLLAAEITTGQDHCFATLETHIEEARNCGVRVLIPHGISRRQALEELDKIRATVADQDNWGELLELAPGDFVNLPWEEPQAAASPSPGAGGPETKQARRLRHK
jgi:hypothetical protein